MFAKPTGRQRLTLSEWVNLISATGTFFSAVFALLAVLAANQQVKVALDVVNRGERLKSLGEFSLAAHDACKAIIPKELWPGLRLMGLRKPEGAVKPKGDYKIFSEPAFEDAGIGLQIFATERDREPIQNVAVQKARYLSIWLESADEKERLNRFIWSLYFTSGLYDDTSKKKPSTLDALSEYYTNCEFLVDQKVEELAR